jgi:hypothetical protein
MMRAAEKREPLFMGTSCFPLSPDKTKSHDLKGFPVDGTGD